MGLSPWARGGLRRVRLGNGGRVARWGSRAMGLVVGRGLVGAIA